MPDMDLLIKSIKQGTKLIPKELWIILIGTLGILAVLTILLWIKKIIGKSKYKKQYKSKNNILKTESSSEKKGRLSEDKTAEMIKNLSEFELIRNPIFTGKNGKTCEVDIILLHEKGVFVIENKDYNGHIYGDEKDYKWKQVFSKNKSYMFYNPLKQNQRHIDVIKEKLKDFYIQFYNVVIFGDNADLTNVTTEIFTIADNRETAIKRMDARMFLDKGHLSKEELIEIKNILLENAKFDKQTRQEHIERIQNIYKQ